MHGVNNINYQCINFVVSLGEEMDPDCKLSLGNTGVVTVLSTPALLQHSNDHSSF